MEIEDKYKNYKYAKSVLETSKTIDNTKVVAEHWWLKPQMVAYSCPVNVMGKDYPSTDFKSINRDLVVVGTRRQNYLFFCMMLDLDGWQLKDSWDYPMEKHLMKQYNANNKKVLCMELRFKE